MLSLMKSVRINHSTSTRTTQFNAGGKVVEDNGSVDLRPYTDWVLHSTNPGASGHVSTPLVVQSNLAADDRKPGLVPENLFRSIHSIENLFSAGSFDSHSVEISGTIGAEAENDLQGIEDGLGRPKSRMISKKLR